MAPSRGLAALFLLALLAAAAPPARADLIRLHDGRTVEGKVSRSGRTVKVKGYKGKSTTYKDSEVKFVEEAECSWDVAAAMARGIPADASDSLFVEKRLEIARYLKERRQYTPELEELERREYEAILRKEEGNEEARAGLGHVKWGEWWFKSEKDRDQFRRTAPPAQMEPLGYLKYRKTGLWEVKEDVEAMEAGKVRHKGRWMTEDEKKEAEGYIKDEAGNWVFAKDLKDRERAEEVEKSMGEKPGTVTSSDHFRFISWYPVGETALMKDLAEKAYAWIREHVGYPLEKENEGGEVLFTDPIDVFALADGKRKDRWLEAYGPGLGYDPQAMEFHKKGSGWHRLSPFPYFVSSGKDTEKNRERDAEEDLHNLGSHLTSMVGRVVLDRIRPGQTMPWMTEGVGLLTEIRFHETADCCYVTQTKYREDVANKAGSRTKYYDFMKAQVASGMDRPMRQIFALELNNLDWADSVKSWCFLEFLLAKYLNEWKQLVRQPFPQVEQILPKQIEAAVLAMRPKDPAAAANAEGGGPKKADEGPIPTEPVTVAGAGAAQVTEGSKEERAIRVAMAEAWLGLKIGKSIDQLEEEWKGWLQTK